MSSNINRVDATLVSSFLYAGSEYLGAHKSDIDALNVFPVPDGDTGINMSLTVSSAVKKISQESIAAGVGNVAGDFALGALMGARGNSGVILSQIFRGISLALADKKDCDALELAAAMQKGVDLSYKSVMKPVEGTILTVFRELVAAATKEANASGDIGKMMRAAMDAGKKALERTPDQLPVLKEAGVVDAGGAGLLCFMQGGMEATAKGQISQFLFPSAAANNKPNLQSNDRPADGNISTADIKYTYCTQLLIKGSDLPIDKIREHLSQTPPGDSLLVVGDENVVKIHFHNNHPGQVLEYCSQFGSIHDIIIDNMVDQHHENQAAKELESSPAAGTANIDTATANDEPENHPECGVIAICCGDGISDIFRELGASVISGGQTMNPSAEDILNAVEKNPAKQLVILPNNSNIILTAEQVKSMASKPVEVVPSKFVTQGLSAMLSFNAESDASTNAGEMKEVLPEIINGELTFSVRPAKLNGFDIAEGDILALLNGDIVASGSDMDSIFEELAAKMISQKQDSEMITLYWGNDLGEAKAKQMAKILEEQYPEQEIEVYFGGQPLYYFLISVE